MHCVMLSIVYRTLYRFPELSLETVSKSHVPCLGVTSPWSERPLKYTGPAQNPTYTADCPNGNFGIYKTIFVFPIGHLNVLKTKRCLIREYPQEWVCSRYTFWPVASWSISGNSFKSLWTCLCHSMLACSPAWTSTGQLLCSLLPCLDIH
jgi:hypothetical protein